MPEDVAVAEPVVETEVTPVDSGVTAPEGVEAAPEQRPEAEGQKPDDAGDGRFLSAELRKHLGELKAVNPKLEKQIRGLFFADKAFKEKFPGGLEEINKIQQKFTELGGEEGLAELTNARQELQTIDEGASKGDPAFVDSILEQFPEAFPKLVEHAVTKWADADEPGYQNYFARVFTATLARGGISNHLYRANLALQMGNVDEAKKSLAAVEQWAEGIKKVAETRPQVPDKQASPDLDKREQTIAQKEAQFFHQEVGREVDAFAKDTLFTEIEKYTKSKLTDDQKDAAWELAQGRLTSALKADQKYLQNSGRFAQARDKDGLVKLQKSELPKVIQGQKDSSGTNTGVAYKVFRLLFSNGMAKPAPKPAPTNGAPKPAPQQGWSVINVRPQAHEIDRRLTSDDMIFDHKYILKSGRKVMLAAQ